MNVSKLFPASHRIRVLTICGIVWGQCSQAELFRLDGSPFDTTTVSRSIVIVGAFVYAIS